MINSFTAGFCIGAALFQSQLHNHGLAIFLIVFGLVDLIFSLID